jgi:hypothetical protein
MLIERVTDFYIEIGKNTPATLSAFPTAVDMPALCLPALSLDLQLIAHLSHFFAKIMSGTIRLANTLAKC